MANIDQKTPTDTTNEDSPENHWLADTEPVEQKQKGINLDEITPEQALSFLTQAVRAQPFTYTEHVQLEQARGILQDGLARALNV